MTDGYADPPQGSVRVVLPTVWAILLLLPDRPFRYPANDTVFNKTLFKRFIKNSYEIDEVHR